MGWMSNESLMRVLTDTDLLGLLSPAALVAVLEGAVRAHDEGRAVAPARTQLEWEDGTLLTMPALAEAVFGIKLVCVIPGQRRPRSAGDQRTDGSE